MLNVLAYWQRLIPEPLANNGLRRCVKFNAESISNHLLVAGVGSVELLPESFEAQFDTTSSGQKSNEECKRTKYLFGEDLGPYCQAYLPKQSDRKVSPHVCRFFVYQDRKAYGQSEGSKLSIPAAVTKSFHNSIQILNAIIAAKYKKIIPENQVNFILKLMLYSDLCSFSPFNSMTNGILGKIGIVFYRIFVFEIDSTAVSRMIGTKKLTSQTAIFPAALSLLIGSCAPSKQINTEYSPELKNVIAPAGHISVLPASPPPRVEPVEPYIEKGTGTFAAETKPNKTDASSIESSSGLTLNMVDVELSDVVSRILGDHLNLGYLIDPRIEGRVTIRTSQEMPGEDVLSILDSVLNLNGAALIEDDGLYKILPMDQVLNAGIRPEVQPVDNVHRFGFGIEIVPVRFIDAGNLVEMLEPLLSTDSTVQINGQRNTVLLVGPQEELSTLIETIRIFDVDWMKGMSFGLFDLEYANAMELVRELQQVFSEYNNNTTTNMVRFVPIKRLNAIIVVATQPTFLERSRTWINKLDRAADGSEEQIYFYSVQNGRAADLANILSSIFEIDKVVVRNDTVNENEFDLAPGLNPIEIETLSEESDVGAREFDEYAWEQERDWQTNSQYFPQRTENNEARIVADEFNNSLLIRATPAKFKKIEAAIREIDVQPVQVLLEATIAEVTLKDELNYGIQWFFRFGSGNVTLSELSTGSIGQGFPGFSGLFSSSDVRAVVDALDSVSDVRIISSPQILVLDNQTAQLEVGDEVPIVTQQSQGADGDSDRLINTIEQRQTGVILNVTPRVNASGLVVLDIQQEVSDVVQTTTSGIDSPTISQRRIGTSVAVNNHQTIALGGLIRDRTSNVNRGIPVLSSIPLLGMLFGATSNATARTELLVLITPQVIRDHGEAQAVTDELRRRFHSLSPLEQKLNIM